MAKTNNYIAGLYSRLSQEDERQGESLPNREPTADTAAGVEEHGFQIYDECIDDGVSGTTFGTDRAQRVCWMTAKTGRYLNSFIIAKDLSRFGRNYIEAGQYVDYVSRRSGLGLRVAIQDNVDTANRDSNAVEMMPI